jgi:5-methyltetrahydropteroyltriglutamate--homocysteine methyltransferase
MVEAHVAGAFPRSEKLVTATRAGVRGNLPQSEVDQVLQDDIKSCIQLQEQSSLYACSDGQLNWQDLFRPFSEILTGIKPGGLTRWFDNNTFYRKPIITDKVTFNGANLQRYFRADQLTKSRHKKAILPSPFTFASLSDNRAYQSIRDLVDDLGHALKEVVRHLQSAGYDYFQFNDPCLCSAKLTTSDLQLAKQGIATCAQANSLVQTYFGDASAAVESLLDFPVDAIGVDFYATPINALTGHKFNKILACGCVDGRNSLLESPDDLKEIVLRVRDELNPSEVYLTPNCDFEFLPRSVADKKVAILGQARHLVG